MSKNVDHVLTASADLSYKFSPINLEGLTFVSIFGCRPLLGLAFLFDHSGLLTVTVFLRLVLRHGLAAL